MFARRAGLIAALVLPALAAAEPWVYSAHGSGGVAVPVGGGDEAAPVGTVLLQSVFSLSDAFNVEGTLLFELGRGGAGALGLGAEYVYFRSNHWRLQVGAGLAARLTFQAPLAWDLCPYLATSVRWRFAWGLGAVLGVHVFAPLSAVSFRVVPSLGLFQEFW